MSINDLFYVLQETDLNNQELYLPPDTPVGKTNQQRLKALLKKHHARQRERLLNQQVVELDEYQKDFANKNKEDLFITQTETACEVMSGPDFLIERNDQIMELLSMIPLIDSNSTTGKDIEMSELTDSVVPDEKSIVPPPPSLPSDDDMDTSEDEEDSLTDMPQPSTSTSGAGCDDDEAIHERKMKYSSIIKKKYRKGFARLRKHHEAQLKKLHDMQKEDLDAITEKTPPPPPPPVPAKVIEPPERNSSPARNTKEQSPRPNVNEKQKQWERGRAVNEQQREALSTAQQTAQQLLKNMHRNHDRSNQPQQHPDRNMAWKQLPSQSTSHTSRITDVSNASKPPTVSSSKPPMIATSRPPSASSPKPPTVSSSKPLIIASSRPPTVSSPKPPMVATSKPPTSTIAGPPAVAPSRPPVVATSRPPIVASSSSRPPTVANSPLPTVVATSQPPTVAPSRPPTVATAGPPSVATAGPSVVATSSSNRNNVHNSSNKSNYNHNNSNKSNNRGKPQRGRRDSNQPLFDTKPITFKPATLLGDTNGFIHIRNKPDRVMINNQDFGSPKDFDDAINGIERTDNRIFRRRLAGDTYLYYKPSAGKYIALGTVSQIQPFIHKFLLSR